MFNFRTTQALHPHKTPWITRRGYAQYDTDLPSEPEGRRVFIAINFQRATVSLSHTVHGRSHIGQNSWMTRSGQD